MSNSGSGPGSSTYSSEFRNLFGGDSSGGDAEASSKDTAAAGPLNSVPPASLLSQEPVGVFEETHLNQNNITPSILLEQLAYVDNFMPSLEQDFASLDSWILQDSEGVAQSQTVQGSNSAGTGAGALGFDERLAAELSAFADDSFIFPDEDKRHAGSRGRESSSGSDGNGNALNGGDDANDAADPSNNGNNNSVSNDNDASAGASGGAGRRSAHFLTQRRNTFLTSQYDHSKSRFSSKSRSKKANDGPSSQPAEEGHPHDNRANAAPSPLQDHGGFTNVDIVSGASNGTGVNNAGSPLLSMGYSPNVPSPLSNILAAQVLQPYSVSASPNTGTAARPLDSDSVTSSAAEQVPSAAAAQGRPQIQMPDYSTIPTSTLVALLPRVAVPPGAHRTLTENGFTQEQIDAIAAVIAHHEQEKLRQSSGDVRASEVSGSANATESDASRNAGFLLDILSRRSPQPESRDAGFADSVLQLEAHVDNPAVHEEPVRSSSLPIKSEDEEVEAEAEAEAERRREHSISLEGSREKEVGEGLMKRSRSTGDGSISTFQKLRKRNTSTVASSPASPPATTLSSNLPMQTPKSHQRRKVKEKELESSVAELSELAVSLQQKVHTLEMENKLLKNLVVSSGELEGIEKAESIRKQLLEKINGSENQGISLTKGME